MFGWRKKNDGFDWHAYVRTTIKVRREVRRERVDAARQAALEKAHAAGQAVADGGKAAGKAAVQGAQAGAVQGAKSVSWFWSNLTRAFRVAFGPLGEWLMAKTAKVATNQKALEFAGPVALIGAIAFTSGAYRWRTVGLTTETLVPLGIGLALLALAAPALLGRGALKWPNKLAVPKLASPRIAMAGAAVLVLGAGAYAVQRVGGPTVPSLGALSKLTLMPSAPPPVEGRANVISADTLRLNNTAYRLSGIEAPDKNQACTRPGNKRWKCGEAALSALEKLAKGKTVKCTPSGSPDAAGRSTATCTIDGKDLAAELVRGGHVFSASSVFGGYASQEGEAKRAKTGLWNGESERPQAYRSKLWDEAKKTAPDGCPIKAVSSGSAKLYFVPWASDYKSTTVRTTKGERWFCSESDATAAGYKAAERS